MMAIQEMEMGVMPTVVLVLLEQFRRLLLISRHPAAMAISIEQEVNSATMVIGVVMMVVLRHV